MPHRTNGESFSLCAVLALPMATDCIPCHFLWEERNAIPLLPEAEQRRILADHAELKRTGYPARAVIEHSEREMEIFRLYLPPAMLCEVHNDHQRFMPVLDAFAANGLPVPLGRIATCNTCCHQCQSTPIVT